MSDGKLRFFVIHQVIQDGLDTGELQGRDSASLSLVESLLRVIAERREANERLRRDVERLRESNA
jgi:hypothetical protein